MLFLLDANTLIDAHRDYYPMDRVPEFWNWLLRNAADSRVKIPVESYEEVVAGRQDHLVSWLRSNRRTLRLEEMAHPDSVAAVVDRGYAPDLKDDEIEKLGRDPFLIAYALRDTRNRCVVTNEARKPGKKRANRHIPDVCESAGVRSIHLFRLIRELDFRTGGNLREAAGRLPLVSPAEPG